MNHRTHSVATKTKALNEAATFASLAASSTLAASASSTTLAAFIRFAPWILLTVSLAIALALPPATAFAEDGEAAGSNSSGSATVGSDPGVSDSPAKASEMDEFPGAAESRSIANDSDSASNVESGGNANNKSNPEDGEEASLQPGWNDLKDGTRRWGLEDGTAATGWLKVDGEWYWLDPEAECSMQVGWKKINGSWYYFKTSGSMATGWIKTNGVWYYLAPSGKMKTGWLKSTNTWYYLKGSGAMATGWQKVDGTWYHLAPSGRMQTGWVKPDGTWYYLKSSGAMKTGWLLDKGYWYYLKSNGAMAANTALSVKGVRYSFGVNGSWSAQRNLYNACCSTEFAGSGLCATWVSRCYAKAGWSYPNGNACDMYWTWCTSSNKDSLAIGMIVAVPTCDGTSLSKIYGHAGIYIGNGLVRHNSSKGLETTSLDDWIKTYGTSKTYPAKWGFPHL